MSDIVRVKPKTTYQWSQDPKYIYINIPIPHNIPLHKLQIYVSDLILRVTSLEKKSTHFLDLAQQIDHLSHENKFIVDDGVLHVTLKKKNQQQWKHLLVEGLSISDLKQRRRDSQARQQLSIKSVEENKEKIRDEYDRKATQQLMKFQQKQRKVLESRKAKEKQQALNYVFGKNQKVQNQENKWKQKERLALQLLEKTEEEERKERLQRIKKVQEDKIIKSLTKNNSKVTNVTNSMFTNQDIQEFQKKMEEVGESQYQPIPIRKQATMKVKFTEKIYPHLAARQQYQKQPPFPKNNIKKNQGQGGDLESKNPLWLKDKGDKFYKDKNYKSSIEAYTEAIKIDPKLIAVYQNRSISFMKLFQYNEAIDDCEQVLNLIQKNIVNGEESEQSCKMKLLKIKSRKAICLCWKGNLKQGKDLIEQLLNNNPWIPQQIMCQLVDCVKKVKEREQSLAEKLKGDREVKLNNYAAAQSHYKASTQIDNNQYSLSNLCLCYNKTEKYQLCLQSAQEGIKRILSFGVTEEQKSNNPAINILLKLYFRKAKAEENMDRLKDSEQSLRKGMSFVNDKQFQTALKQNIKKQKKQKLQLKKKEGAQLLKKNQFKQSLNIYSQCLKLVDSSQDIIDQLAILQNQTLCYLGLQEYDSVISIGVRAIKIIENYQKRIVSIDGRKTDKAQKQKIQGFLIRILVRRAHAYIKTGQYHNGKSDLQRAIQLDPNNQKLKIDLENLKHNLGK